MTDKGLPSWWNQLITQHKMGVGRVFVLHHNVNDVVYYPSDPSDADLYRISPRPFRDMLMYLLAMRGKALGREGEWDVDSRFIPIFYCSPTIPLTLYYLKYNEDTKSNILDRILVDREKLRKRLEELPNLKARDIEKFIQEFPRRIRSESRVPERNMVDLLFEIEPLLEQYESDFLEVVLILDFFEKIATQHERRSHYVAEEIIRRWALSDRLKRSRNMVIALTINLEALPELLRKSDSQIQAIEIPISTTEERRNFLSYWRTPLGYDGRFHIAIANLDEKSGQVTEEESGKEEDIQLQRVQQLADLTKGFRLLNLEAMVRMSKAKSPEGEIDLELLKKHKSKLINEESFRLLEEIESERGFEAIGGLKYAKEYFKKIARAMVKAQSEPKSERFVPKGILLSGPPGTGKTILAQALAREGNATLVKLADIRGSYVGESEQNMSRVLKLLEELAPVVVFVDEIDQSIGRRGTGIEGDSGVDRRLFGKLLAFMGDNEYRAKVLWIGASNRPDLLDEAMISRFDTVMAIIPPYALDERIHILKVMEENIKGVTYSESIRQNLPDIAEKLDGLSGRAIETLIRKAAELTESDVLGKEHIEEAIKLFKLNVNIREIDEWTVRALMAVNFTDMLPNDPEVYPPRLRDFVKRAIGGETKNNLPLQECLEKIRDGRLYKDYDLS